MLGWQVKDKITGFQGIVTGYVRYLTGCNQALVTPKATDGGAMVDPQWIDEQRLERVGSTAVTLDNLQAPGFDRAPPKR